jgi:hypothetical protein
MICPTCYRMLRGQRGRRWRGTYDLQFDHHTERIDLQRSSELSEVGCCICRKIWNELQRIEADYDGDQHSGHSRRYRTRKVRKHFISAFLAEVPRQRGLYRLDFKFGSPLKRLATFLLQQTTNESDAQIYTPLSTNSNSEEVLQLARFWLRNCTQEHSNCPNEDFYTRKPFYPTRLIKLLDNEEEVQLVSKDTLVCKVSLHSSNQMSTAVSIHGPFFCSL